EPCPPLFPYTTLFRSRGPWENYPDRKTGADMGVWASTVTEQAVPYVKPQENGNKEDVRWVELTDAGGNGLKISAEANPLSFSARSEEHTSELQSPYDL